MLFPVHLGWSHTLKVFIKFRRCHPVFTETAHSAHHARCTELHIYARCGDSRHIAHACTDYSAAVHGEAVVVVAIVKSRIVSLFRAVYYGNTAVHSDITVRIEAVAACVHIPCTAVYGDAEGIVFKIAVGGIYAVIRGYDLACTCVEDDDSALDALTALRYAYGGLPCAVCGADHKVIVGMYRIIACTDIDGAAVYGKGLISVGTAQVYAVIRRIYGDGAAVYGYRHICLDTL